LALSVNQAAERGIQAASVHDCYAAIAPDVSAFADIRHFALGVMYYHNPLEELWKHNVLDKDALPMLKLGNFDPLTAAFSEYSEV
jgi:DNA-directed RNA polymerase